MVFHNILPKIGAHWLVNLYRSARKLRSLQSKPSTVAASACTIPAAAGRTVLCDFHGGILRSRALFPYFMLVAFEGGSFLRALLLLVSFPLVWMLGEHSDASLRVMAFVTFVGLGPRDADLVARAILPKFYMEKLNAEVYDRLWLPAKRKVAVTSTPKVMAEWFLKEYMAADIVVGNELQMIKVGRRCYFTGLLGRLGPLPGGMTDKVLRSEFGVDGGMADVAVVGSSNPLNHLFSSYCKGHLSVCGHGLTAHCKTGP
ncbi:hypothetical protein ACQJBY_022723 [Aegilops geniculata]